MTGQFAGQSLGFVRRLLGLPAHYVSAKDAYAESEVHLGLPPIGTIVWFAGGPWGDCALSLGEEKVLSVNHSGDPYISTITGHSTEYLGWSYTIGGPDEASTGPGYAGRSDRPHQ